MDSHHRPDDWGKKTGNGKHGRHTLLRALITPGRANVGLCYLLTLSAVLSPAALLFAVLFAEPENGSLHQHYYYLRTTIALLVIGFSAGSLLIVFGASLSSLLILAGLALLTLTALLTLLRCLSGFVCAFRSLPLRNYKSYFI